MPELPAPSVTPSRYDVSCLPEGDINTHSFLVTVEYRGRNLWAVLHGSFCLGRDGGWSYESIPSERKDDWLAEHRFDLFTALALAKKAAPNITVNRWTVADALARHDKDKD